MVNLDMIYKVFIPTLAWRDWGRLPIGVQAEERTSSNLLRLFICLV